MADSFKNMANKATEKLTSDKAKEAVDKLGNKADKATGGRYSDKVDKGQEMLRDQMEKRKKSGGG